MAFAAVMAHQERILAPCLQLSLFFMSESEPEQPRPSTQSLRGDQHLTNPEIPLLIAGKSRWHSLLPSETALDELVAEYLPSPCWLHEAS